jgi:hypothetical protein
LKDPLSPFYKIVKHPGTDQRKAPIAYNSLFSIVTAFHTSAIDFQDDTAKLVDCIKRAFNIIKKVWPEAWGKAPTESRLTHGAGLQSMGRVLVHLIDTNYKSVSYDLQSDELWKAVEESLKRLESRVKWTTEEALSGTKAQKNVYTEEISKRQNTRQDVDALTSFLLKECTFLEKQALKPGKTTVGER